MVDREEPQIRDEAPSPPRSPAPYARPTTEHRDSTLSPAGMTPPPTTGVGVAPYLSGSDSVPLVTIGGDSTARKDCRRWFVLLVFGLVCASVSAFWATIPATISDSKTYYGWDDSDISVVVAWQAILYFPMAIYASFFTTLERGVRSAAVQAGVLCAVAGALRCVPTIAGTASTRTGPASSGGHAVVHVAHAVGAMAAPLVLATPSAVSANWFPARQRAIATSVAVGAYSAGIVVVYALAATVGLRALIFGTAGAAIVSALVAVLALPALPKHAPSITGAKYRMSIRRSSLRLASATTMPRFAQATVIRYLRAVLIALRKPGSLLLFLSGGLQLGASSVWGLSLSEVLLSTGSSTNPGWLCFVHAAFTVIGIVAAGLAADALFRRRLRPFTCFVLIAQALFVCVLVVISALPASSVPKFLLSPGFTTTNVALIALFAGAAMPMFYELSAEIAYPTPEGVSAALMTFVASLVVLTFTLITPKIGPDAFGTVIAGSTMGLVAVSMIVLALLRFRYSRLDLDEGLDLGDNPIVQ